MSILDALTDNWAIEFIYMEDNVEKHYRTPEADVVKAVENFKANTEVFPDLFGVYIREAK
tara:strand:+ start:189443 stop:189622 length:180 start_codon:yes stop_codon:yes gene_type:complete